MSYDPAVVSLHIIIVIGVDCADSYLGLIIAVTLYFDPCANVITPSLVAYDDILFLLLFIFNEPYFKTPDTTLYILLYVVGVPTALA